MYRENAYHADEKPRLLCGSSNASVTDDANCKACGETCETDRETCTEVYK